MSDVARARLRGDGGRGRAQDELSRAVLRPRVRLRVHASHVADPRGHEPPGLRPGRARARDGVVGLVRVRVDDERNRRREHRDAADRVRGHDRRVLHGPGRPARVPGRGRVVRGRVLRRARPQLRALRLGGSRRSRGAPRGGASVAVVRRCRSRRARGRVRRRGLPGLGVARVARDRRRRDADRREHGVARLAVPLRGALRAHRHHRARRVDRRDRDRHVGARPAMRRTSCP